MRHIHLATMTAVGLALAACAGGEEQAAADEEATEATGDADPAAGDTGGTQDALFIDESGFVDPAVVAEMQGRLADFLDETDKAVMVITILSTDGEDIEAAAERMRQERGADALILVAGGDQELAIVGINDAASSSAEESMTNALDNGMIREAFDMGIGLTTDTLRRD